MHHVGLDKSEVQTLWLLFLPCVFRPIQSLTSLAPELFGDIGVSVVIPLVIPDLADRAPFSLLDLPCDDLVAVRLQPKRFALFDHTA